MTSTARNLALVLICRSGLLALSLLVLFVVFRVLDHDAAGRFAICLTIIRLLSDCLGEPLDMSVLREVPTALTENSGRATAILRGAFQVRVAAACALVALVALAAPWLAATFLHSAGDSDLVLAAACGAAGTLLFRANLVYFQCHEDFRGMVFADSVLQVGRFAAIVGLAATGWLTARTGVLAYVAMTFVAFAGGTFFLPPSVRRWSRAGCEEIPAVLQFAKWMLAVTVLAAVYERTNEFLISQTRGPGELSYYSAAMTLAMLPDFLTGCLSAVFQPRALRVLRDGSFGALLRRYLRYSVPAGAALALAIVFLGRPVMLLAFGSSYAAAITPFRILALATVIWLVFSPLPAILFVLRAPRLNLVLNGIMLVLMVTVGAAVVRKYGATGGACMFLGTRCTSLIVIGIVASWLVREQAADSAAATDADASRPIDPAPHPAAETGT